MRRFFLLTTSLFFGELSAAIVLDATHDGYVVEGDPDATFNNDLLLVKDEIGTGLANRKSWIVFDISDGTIDLSQDASFTLTLGDPTAPGRPVSSPNLTIGIYALNAGFTPGTGELGTGWTEAGLTWNNAPGNSSDDQNPDATDTTFLGSIFVPGSPIADPAGSTYSITFANPSAYLQADDSLTLILTSRTSSDSNAKFASSENANFAGPQLTLQTIPEPSVGAIVLTSGILLMRRRNRHRPTSR